MAIKNIVDQRSWINGKECSGLVTVRIHQEQEIKRHPLTGEPYPGKLSTRARLLIDCAGLGGDEEKTVLDLQKRGQRITLAHTQNDSVLIAANLIVIEFTYDSTISDSAVEFDCSFGEPLEMIPLNEFLASKAA